MIKIVSFTIHEFEAANRFMQDHPPRSTEKQSGVVFHDGNIVIIYDDGNENPNDLLGLIRSQLEGDRHKQVLVQHSLETAVYAIESEREKLKELNPKYVSGMSDNEIREILGTDGNAEYVPAAQVAKFRDAVGPIENRIVNLENQMLMDRHEFERLQYSIDGWMAMLPHESTH